MLEYVIEYKYGLFIRYIGRVKRKKIGMLGLWLGRGFLFWVMLVWR